jgi:2-(1,2-epoxy-1,2-dihydrophenyl)acetyl-CoA isomerase
MTDLRVDVRDETAVLTIDRVDAHNSIGGTLFKDLLDAATALDRDDAVRSVVVTAEGRIWCAGGDVDRLGNSFGPGADASWLVHRNGLAGETGLCERSDVAVRLDRLGIGEWALLFRQVRKPFIAAINGAAVGGGFALSLLFDIRVAAAAATFNPAFGRYGVGPELGTSWFLPRIVGSAAAAEILLTCRTLNAARAREIGLVDLVVDDHAQLLPAALAVGAAFAERDPLEVQATLEIARRLGQPGAATAWSSRTT